MKHVEFFIIGQGLAGTLLAFEMLDAGIDFRIISSPKKSKASNIAAGMINPLVFKRLTKSWMLDDLLPVMQATYEKLEVVLGEKFYFKKDIVKPLSEKEEKMWRERALRDDFKKYILSISNKPEVKQLHQSFAYAKVSSSGYLDLHTFLQASDLLFRKRNLVIDNTFDFGKISEKQNIFEIEEIKASNIVCCEGHHVTLNPLFQFVKMNPTKGEILLIQTPELSEEFILNKRVFVLPVGDFRFKVGSTYQWKNINEMPTEEGRLSIVERLDKLISCEYSIEKQWAGIRPTVVDRRPVLGIHPEFDNVSIFNGLGTKGVMLAPYFAKEMLKLLTTRNYELKKEVNSNRFL